MRILFVADGRSPIALNWIRYFTERGDKVYLASTYPCSSVLPLEELVFTPVAYSRTKKPASPTSAASGSLRRLLMTARHLLGPLTISRASGRLRTFAERIQPDLVHAMRIPFEGMLAADAYQDAPLLVSVWGNDFTLHAPSTGLMRHYTSWTLQVANALHADCHRDVRLARQWGLVPSKPVLVAPGGGGIRNDVFFPSSSSPGEPIIINPRGSRSYVRSDTFFKSIPLILARKPNARFLCVSMAHDQAAVNWVARLGVGHAVELLPHLSQQQLADHFRRSQVLVSPSVHDGTPNSLLEGMASGCFPIAGDLESIREWIKDGENGLLIDPNSPQALADAVIHALDNKILRQDAAGLNRALINERAEYSRCMAEAGDFYNRIIPRSPVRSAA